MTEEHKKLHPAAFRKLEPGETYEPIVPASAAPLEVTARSVGIGLAMAVLFSAGLRLPRPQGGAGDGARHPDRHPRGRARRRLRPAEHHPRERHHPVDRGGFGGRRRRGRLHHPRALHARIEGQLLAHLPHRVLRRLPRHLLPHPAPPVPHGQGARASPVPGGDGDDGDPRRGRGRGLAGQGPHLERRRWRSSSTWPSSRSASGGRSSPSTR